MRKLTKVTVYSNESSTKPMDNVVMVEQIQDLREKPHFHFIILRDGTINSRYPIEDVLHDHNSVDFCLTGVTSFTPDQYVALGSIYMAITQEHGDLVFTKDSSFKPTLKLFGE